MTYNNNTDVKLKSKTVLPTVLQNQHQGHGFTSQKVNAYKISDSDISNILKSYRFVATWCKDEDHNKESEGQT
jgi:hypothetical protein